MCPDGCTGSLICPYNTIREGVAAQGHGTALSIEANVYYEAEPANPILFNKRGEVNTTNGAVEIR